MKAALDGGALRRWLANKLASLARRIYPKSEEVMSFYTDRMIDQMITGSSFVKISRVKPEDIMVTSDGYARNTKDGKWQRP